MKINKVLNKTLLDDQHGLILCWYGVSQIINVWEYVLQRYYKHAREQCRESRLSGQFIDFYLCTFYPHKESIVSRHRPTINYAY